MNGIKRHLELHHSGHDLGWTITQLENEWNNWGTGGAWLESLPRPRVTDNLPKEDFASFAHYLSRLHHLHHTVGEVRNLNHTHAWMNKSG